MDNKIRVLLDSINQDNDTELLHEVHQLLKYGVDARDDSVDAIQTSWYILTAEVAFERGYRALAKDCLEMFFQKSPPENQFLGRAYLCEAMLSAPTSKKDFENLEIAVSHINKALNFAKKNSRYHFLAYNASVIYWQFCRPFLTVGYKRHLAKSLHFVVKALDDIDDKDYEWRAKLMIALIECHIDAGRRDDAVNVAQSAASFTKANVSHMFKEVFALQIYHKLADSQKLTRDTKQSVSLNLLYRVKRLRLIFEGKEPQPTGKTPVEQTTDVEITKLLKKIAREDETNVQSGRKSVSPSSSLSREEQIKLLLELAILCFEFDKLEVAEDCVTYLTKFATDPANRIRTEYLQCQLTVKKLGSKQEIYTSSVIELRLKVIQKMENAVASAIRLGNPDVIQTGCVVMWNLCLPLLQVNLRKNIKKSLELIANALEQLDSLMNLLRCQIHIELAKCEESEEQIQPALRHIEKALSLDDAGRYTERLASGLRRLRLRMQLYQTPERPEDCAAQIIEQARSSDDKSTVKMRRALLVQAGKALSPDAFAVVIDSERDVTAGKDSHKIVGKLAARAKHWTSCMGKAKGHIKRIGQENDKERVRLWGDLAKLARKQEVWDVARVASTFCLLYDDGRWNVNRITDPSTETVISKTQNLLTTKEEIVAFNNVELIRLLSEVYFIHAEAYICKLRDEGVLLGNSPVPPADAKIKTKNDAETTATDDPDWKVYCGWIKSLGKSAIEDFKRALQLGCDLNEPWLVYSAAVYLWNYCKHKFDQGAYRDFVPVFQSTLTAIKTVGINGEAVLYTEISYAIAQGIMQPWVPELPVRLILPEADKMKQVTNPSTTVVSNRTVHSSMTGSDGSMIAGTAAAGSKVPRIVNVDPDATPELKQAMDIIENALTITNGSIDANKVPLALRHKLLTTWVFLRQLLNVTIGRNLSHEHDEPRTPTTSASRAIVAVEMISASRNGLGEFNYCPTMNDAIKYVENANISWNDCIVELYLWSKLAHLANQLKHYHQAINCAVKALKFASRPEIASLKTNMKSECQFNYIYAHELLSSASSVLGQAYVETMGGRIEQRRLAMQAFVDSVKYAHEAKSYNLAINATRHYWNACLPLVKLPLERELLIEPLTILLQCLASLSKSFYKNRTEEKVDVPSGQNGNKEAKQGTQDAQATSEDNVDDLTIRAAMYGVLFLAYADKNQYEEGLRAMDKAINNMPRTAHRLLIFKHRVIFKAKLGKNVLPDIAKFRDESEGVVAEMWRYVAECSTDNLEQLSSYQNSIEALKSYDSEWQKYDYLLEFGCWLYCNQYSAQDALDQFEWAADIILSMAQSERFMNIDNKQLADKNSDTSSDSDSYDDEFHGINPSDYIPIKSEEIIGIIPSEIPVIAKDVKQIKQLEALLRVHVIMASICDRSSPKYRKYVYFAWTYLMRMWKMSQLTASKTLHELAMIQERQAEAKRNKDKNAGKDAKEFPKLFKKKAIGTHPLAALPSSIDGWSTFELPDDFRNVIKNDATGCAFNKISIVKPMLTFHIMEELIDHCCQSGYHQLCPPILSIMTLLAQDIIEHKTLLSKCRLLCIDINQQLNLLAGIKHSEQMAGDVVIDESEQAKSREEIHEWQEIQNRVKREGDKIAAKKKATVRFEDEIGVIKVGTKPRKSNIELKTVDQNLNSRKSLKRVFGNVCMRDLWTDMAELLIKQGRYQSARQFLTEAQYSAEVFGDKESMTRIYYNFALLLYREANIPQALATLVEAQKNSADLKMWLKTILCMTDVLLQDDYRKSQAKSVLLHAIGCLLELVEERKNEIGMICYVKARITARLAALEMEDAVAIQHRNQLQAALINALEHYKSSIHDLKAYGYKREAVKVLKEFGHLKNLLASAADNVDNQHKYLLEALQCYEEAVKLSNEVYLDSITLMPVLKPKEASLPVQREAVESRIAFANQVIVVMIKADAEEQHRRRIEARKDSVQRAFDEYVRPTPIPNSVDTIWKSAVSTLSGKALTHLSVAHYMAGSITKLKAEVLYTAGRCLRLKAYQSCPNETLPWSEPSAKELLGILNKNEKDNDEISEEFLDDRDGQMDNKSTTDPESDPLKRRITENLWQIDFNSSQSCLAQANDCLTQCVHMCLSNKDQVLLSQAALEMVECCGKYDSLTSAQYLALHQSCAAAQYLHVLLLIAQNDPTASRQAALLQQREHVKKTDATLNELNCSTLKNNADVLEINSEAWKFLTIAPNHLDLMKDLPQGISCIILQHSPDKSVLYAALLEKSKTSFTKSVKSTAQGLPVNASVARVDVSPSILDTIVDKYIQFKQDVVNMFVRSSRQKHYQLQDHYQSAVDLDRINKERSESQPEKTEEEEALQAQFNRLVFEVEEYLAPVLCQFDFLGRPATGRTGTSNMSGPAGSTQTATEFLVILADERLLRLPLEAISFFKSATVSSISRDFSLQTLRHRIIDDDRREKREKRRQKVNEQAKRAISAKGKDKKGKQQQNLMERAPPASGFNINSSYVRYIVDTRNNGGHAGDNSPCQVMSTMTKSKSNVTSKWYGIMGNDHVPSLGEWQRLLLQSSAFVYYGYERCLADFQPRHLAPVTLQDCRLAVLLDQMHDFQSFYHQAKTDAQKNAQDIQMEEPLEAAALFSLCGVGCIVVNQWGTSLQQNKQRMLTLTGSLQPGNKAIGQIVYTLLDPIKDKKTDSEMRTSQSVVSIKSISESHFAEDKEKINLLQSSYEYHNTVVYGLPNLVFN